jgi:hypothetical protein
MPLPAEWLFFGPQTEVKLVTFTFYNFKPAGSAAGADRLALLAYVQAQAGMLKLFRVKLSRHTEAGDRQVFKLSPVCTLPSANAKWRLSLGRPSRSQA